MINKERKEFIKKLDETTRRVLCGETIQERTKAFIQLTNTVYDTRPINLLLTQITAIGELMMAEGKGEDAEALFSNLIKNLKNGKGFRLEVSE